ncbi:uncharacterized protein LOC111907614 [Lactuca sativa]|uniref:uncharacterized protein LOC111907614 n=1 Tax=Lactuca sativa TaxID=4236 RepID=UPI000CD9741F|nr:uncharacterized protein LOC111907614 [Lactuca sativa]
MVGKNDENPKTTDPKITEIPKTVDSKITENPYGIANIRSSIPIILDLERMNYDSWHELFETHCSGFGVGHHLQPPADPASSDMEEWKRIDNIVKMWIYGMLSPSLL